MTENCPVVFRNELGIQSTTTSQQQPVNNNQQQQPTTTNNNKLQYDLETPSTDLVIFAPLLLTAFPDRVSDLANRLFQPGARGSTRFTRPNISTNSSVPPGCSPEQKKEGVNESSAYKLSSEKPVMFALTGND